MFAACLLIAQCQKELSIQSHVTTIRGADHPSTHPSNLLGLVMFAPLFLKAPSPASDPAVVQSTGSRLWKEFPSPRESGLLTGPQEYVPPPRSKHVAPRQSNLTGILTGSAPDAHIRWF